MFFPFLNQQCQHLNPQKNKRLSRLVKLITWKSPIPCHRYPKPQCLSIGYSNNHKYSDMLM